MRWFVAGDPWLSGTAPTEYYRYDFGNFRWLRRGWNGIPELTLRDAAGQPIADYTIDPQTDQAVWKKEYISGFGQVLAERSQASNVMTLMSGARATGATVVPFSVGTGLPSGTTLAVDIRTDAGPWAHLTGVAVNAQGQFSIADSNFATGESNFVRVKREDQPDAAYSQPIALVVDPSVTSSSASTINHISISRLGTDLKLRWSLAANNNKLFKILFRRADNNTELDLTPMGLPANSRELSLGSQSQNLPAGNFLAHQVLGTVDQGGLGGHFEDGTIPPPTATGPVYITQYHHRDHLGTLRLITDEMGGLIEAHDYEPFGVELNPPFGAASRKKYTGHERDETTGLDYMLACSHSLALGRFLSADPALDVQNENPQSWNLYGYVRNNPVNATAPTGEAGKDVAEWIDRKMSAFANWVDSKTGGGAVGVALNAAAGTTRDLVSGAADMLHVGSATDEAIGTGATGTDMVNAVCQDVGRASAMALTLAAPVSDVERAGAGAEGAAAAEPAAAPAAVTGLQPAPGFVVTQNGEAIVVPHGVTGPTATRASSMQYTGGSEGPGLDARVSGVRIMDANANQGARVVNMNGPDGESSHG